MTFAGLLLQLLNGLASASSLFLVAAGLSLIFGVTRIVNFAHGSFYMLGVFVAVAAAQALPPALGFWGALPVAALAVGLLGVIVEVLLLRRIYHAPELFQLLATFALVLILKDAALFLWGAEPLLGPRAPGLEGSATLLGRRFPSYDLFLIGVGPLVLLLLHGLLSWTRLGMQVRAATQDRAMLSALGVDQARLFTLVFALGSMLAGLGGALQMPREAASLDLDLSTIGSAFVVVVVGGLGSIPGAFLAALLIEELKAVCNWIGTVEVLGTTLSFSRFTLVVEFVVMALVLVLRPWGLLGQPQAAGGLPGPAERPLVPAAPRVQLLVAASVVLLLAWPWVAGERFAYSVVLGIDLMVAVLFASSLHFIMGPGGMASFGHAASFGLGGYGAALLSLQWGWPVAAALAGGAAMAAVGAAIVGGLGSRLGGTYLAMLTLALAQVAWGLAHQWDEVTGGSNGLGGVWPPAWLEDRRAFWTLCLGTLLLSLWSLRRIVFSPFGQTLRAVRDSAPRAQALGTDVRAVRWTAFVVAGLFGGLAGALAVFSKGSVSPDALAIARSVDGLVMVLLGGVQSLAGPVVGALTYTALQDFIMRSTPYWHAVLGGVILLLVLLFPGGVAAQLGRLVPGRMRRTEPQP